MPDSAPISFEHLKVSFAAFVEGMKEVFVDTPEYLPKSFVLCARFLILGIILLLCILTIEMARNSLQRKLKVGYVQGVVCVVLLFVLFTIFSPRVIVLPVKTEAGSASLTYNGSTMPIGKAMREDIISQICKQKASIRLQQSSDLKPTEDMRKLTICYDYAEVNIQTSGKSVYYFTDTKKDFLYEISDTDGTFKKYLAEIKP